MSVEKIQKIRKELALLIEKKVKPLKEELERLLNEEAMKLCPFSVGDVIQLNNGKMGKIIFITYYTLDYGFSLQNEFSDFIPKLECDIDYRFAYEIDDAKFSITWNISGVRMIQNGTKEGKTTFTDINPAYYKIDVKNKSVASKDLYSYLDDIGDLAILEPLLAIKK